MSDVLAVAAVVPAAVGACCTAAGRRSAGDRLLAVASASVGATAMVDAMIGPRLVPVLAWAVILTVLALLTALRLRLRTSSPASGDHLPRRGTTPASAHALSLHGAVGSLLMAGLLLLGAHPGATPVTPGAHGHGSSMLVGLPALAVLAFGLSTAVVCIRLARTRAWLGIVESCMMALAAALMLLVHG